MKQMKRNKVQSHRKMLVLVGTLVLTTGIGLLLYFRYWHKNPGPTTSYGEINLAPSTEQDKEYNDQVKENISNSQNSNTNSQDSGTTDQDPLNSSALKTVKPTITYANVSDEEVMVSAYINGVIEDDGTCTLTLTKDSSQSVTEQVASVANASNTSCPSMNIPVSKLERGVWVAKVSYSSSTATGVSDPNEVEVK